MITYALIAEEPAPAPGTGADPNQQQGSPYTLFIMMALIFGVFYFLLIRPQRQKEKQRQKDHAEMLKNLTKSDHVMTLGGIYGVVAAVTDSDVVIKIDEKNDVRIRVARDYIKVLTDDDKGKDADEAVGEKKLPDTP